MESAHLNALLDSDVLLDFLDGHAPATEKRSELAIVRDLISDGGDGRRANTAG